MVFVFMTATGHRIAVRAANREQAAALATQFLTKANASATDLSGLAFVGEGLPQDFGSRPGDSSVGFDFRPVPLAAGQPPGGDGGSSDRPVSDSTRAAGETPGPLTTESVPGDSFPVAPPSSGLPTLGPGDDIRPAIGADVTAFPFQSFANALSRRGLNTEGVLGSTLSSQFTPLDLARDIGEFTGSVASTGDEPGSLENFFGSNLGGSASGLARQVFGDLRSGAAAPGLDPEQNLRLNALREPDLATPGGVTAANEVFDLARAAARNRFGSSADLLGSNAQLQRQFARRLAQGQQPDFLQFAAQAFGL